jgi:NAD(P)-dependent dehydrogenase (short-subunit alcohol dehydrogenase family)
MRAREQAHRRRARVEEEQGMLMSVVEGARSAPAYPELAGKRVLVTGVSSRCGVDLARSFADHKVRLILQFDELSDETHAIAEIAAPAALDIRAFGPVAPEAHAVVEFARSAMLAFGRLDAVINLVALAPAAVGIATSLGEIERRVARRLLLPCLIGKIAANRMALSYIEGLILNVAMLTPPLNGPARAFACVAKTALTAMTRAQAEEWAGKAIRFNAICPETADPRARPRLAGEPEVAELALYLASGRGKALSGQVFEAEPAR